MIHNRHKKCVGFSASPTDISLATSTNSLAASTNSLAASSCSEDDAMSHNTGDSGESGQLEKNEEQLENLAVGSQYFCDYDSTYGFIEMV